jgi:hypothetical protein
LPGAGTVHHIISGQSALLASRPDYPESRHHIDLNGFPRGPKTSTQFGDMFNEVALNRMASHVLPRGRLVDLFKDFVRFAKST